MILHNHHRCHILFQVLQKNPNYHNEGLTRVSLLTVSLFPYTRQYLLCILIVGHKYDEVDSHQKCNTFHSQQKSDKLKWQ